MILKNIIKYIFILFLFFSVIIFFYGKRLDISQQPEKSDMIVCLGGGYIERVQKSVELYNTGFAKDIVITGTGIGLLNSSDEIGFWKTQYLKKKGVPKDRMIELKETPNTYAEMVVLKKYMLKHHLKQILIVSDPPHLRRIRYILDRLEYDDAGLSVRLVGSDVKWWSKSRFCSTPKELWESAKEIVGLIYYFIRY